MVSVEVYGWGAGAERRLAIVAKHEVQALDDSKPSDDEIGYEDLSVAKTEVSIRHQMLRGGKNA